jgi:predicted component of type VI protein secretion system
MKGLHDCSFRDVRVISNSQSLLKNEASIDMVEALKRLAPRKALGPFDVSAGPLPTDQPASENGPSSRINSVSRSAFPVTSGPAEDAQTWFPIIGSRAPLDLSLTHMARFTSPDSLHCVIDSAQIHNVMDCNTLHKDLVT